VDGRELHFIVFVDHADSMEGSGKAALRTAFEESFTHGSAVLNVLSDKLVDRDVDHVVFDGQVGAGDINRESGVVVDQDDLGAEESLDVLSDRLGGLVDVKGFIFCHVVTAILEGLSHLSLLGFISSASISNLLGSFFGHFFSALVSLSPSDASSLLVAHDR
jgi:hypothetical protein